ncbi:helix-turn-helix transcriptional regulator [Paenibacillus sp. OAS669]|uniref:helix-turn-helix transcriptional regulator n=1 Tax=Paenibacillus sp. OAS669 TaxID=2663821 RepID=UPI00178BFFCD|nr:AraC family transcriptional regulator [Paenibacillus sp. OAS669]MBE1442848.1 AraC-like DNA-binding protein [Paenibacillus sp. OAS669]
MDPDLYNDTGQFLFSYLNEKDAQLKPLQHYHNSFEFDFFIKADLHIFLKDNTYAIRDGNFFFINEYEIHRLFYSPNRPYERYVINFSKDFVKRLLSEAELVSVLKWIVHEGPRKVETDLAQRESLLSLFSKIRYAYSRYTADQDAISLSEIRLNLLLLLIEYHRIASKQPAAPSSNPHIQALIRYIDDNYMNPITLEQLEDTFGLSKYYICHLFKETSRFTLFEYLLNRRVIEAKKLLENTDQDIIQIALSCGFQNLQHFYRIFKRSAKVTPLQYRKIRSARNYEQGQ